MKQIQIEPEAVEDLRSAFEWYESQRTGLGDEFIEQFEVVQERIAALPLSFPPIHRKARKALLRRFPYIVLFCDFPNQISVIGVFHSSRDPATIQKRIG